ncbi:MAG TPA: hypothetical protein VGI64_14110 [Streptosporangiaceae bacterium]|jgi:hypothetical protein
MAAGSPAGIKHQFGRPSLDEVFLAATGAAMDGQPAGDEAGVR